ncbi:hypothetical protein C7974DRAFT_397016 [Boeremia exigua]|uniref:uncharacterized protein n=1 Tax=Boeremia exigua TaxID=749465 RepID=UPI001E8D081F|nr:uncharacterized protein C7974DRAFT_397016 [Boeremia exigua]KAH6621711.1 hypothetical protein C7974DRAFT_397016 [Boeremia exigua]
MAHAASASAAAVDSCSTAPAASEEISSEVTRKRRRTEKSRVGAAYPRKRAVAACQLCRVRKVKCNNARPSCGGCLSSQISCVYEDSQDHSAFDPASILILDRLNQVLARLDQGPSSSANTSPTAPTPGDSVHASTTATSDLDLAVEQESYDQLRVPSSQTTPDTILSWPVFQRQFPASFTTDSVFEAEVSEDIQDSSQNDHTRFGQKVGGVNEECIPKLIKQFLQYVHIKNPVVDMDTIAMYAHTVSEEGIKWDTASCLVILACALGCVARPFRNDPSSPLQCTSLDYDEDALRQGEAYYNCARRRFGLLKAGISATQCHFLAGVYLMYTMRPLSAWSQFRSASASYHLHLDFQARRVARYGCAPVSPERRHLETSLYWSCYKSECELRMELNLPDSSLVNIQYPDLHPVPPWTDTSSISIEQLGTGKKPRQASSDALDLQQQETSWFYYLTEITLRRLRNSVLNTLYVKDYREWTDEQIPYMTRAAIELEQQLKEWYNGLPAPLRYENDVIPSEELPWLARGRELEIRIQIYQPFLYYAIHQLCNSSYGSTVIPLAQKALLWSFYVIEEFPTRHRHHGTWYGIRFNISASFLILAAVKSEALSVRSDWQRMMSASIHRLAYWKDEAPGLSEAIEVIQYYL